MNKLRAVLDGGLPAVAVSFQNSGDVESGTLVGEAIAVGVDIAELRIDRFPQHDSQAALEYASYFRELPTIATIRSAQEGGEWNDSEHTRLELFRAVMPHVDGVDVELSAHSIVNAVIESAKSADRVAIVSYHNFEITPDDAILENVLNNALEVGADYVKISSMAKTLSDVQRLAEFLLAHRSKPLIVIAMGAVGTMSRIFFPALGSRMTYSFIGGNFAPGQMDYEETFHMLRKFYPEYSNKKIVDLGLLEGV